MITSIANEKVRYVRSLSRRRVRYREKRFVIEGVRLIKEAFRAGVLPALLFYSGERDDFSGSEELLTKIQASEIPAFAVSEKVMKAMTATISPPGILAVVPFPELTPRPNPSLILVVDGLRDPGNLGTILRSAEAAGVGLAILSPKTVDHYNPKVVRGAMGAHFHLPISILSWTQIAEALAGVEILLADVRGGKCYYEVDWTKPSALIIGGEAHGPSQEARELATVTITIPMHGGAESLNAAVAASIVLFEAARQRACAAGFP